MKLHDKEINIVISGKM